MRTILIFGGTTEGRREAEAALARGERVTVSVTSEYARQFLPKDAACHVGALDEAAMTEFIRACAPEEVVDATHPFAVRATETIRACARRLSVRYRRVERDTGAEEIWSDAVIWVDSPEEAADMLARTEGNILLTTGSHTLCAYSGRVDAGRLYARVLPSVDSLRLCAQAGLPASHIIAMQGPFSRPLNAALYDQLNISVMVSKESGELGGVTDKVLPALEREIQVIMIRRPKEENSCAVSH